MDKWGRRVSSLELIEPSKEPEKETQELHPSVDLQLQAHAKYMTEETKKEIRAVLVESQTKLSLVRGSAKLSLAEIPRNFVKRMFLKKTN